ncbi:MAG: valine--tRNA ligase [Candidatus Woesearchaeota archaeon]
MELPKNYNTTESEKKWSDYWQDKEIFKFDENSESEVYSVDTPPPTVSGKMHLGHSFSYAQQDYVVRYQRMKGKNVFYPFGTDDNGLPTDKLVEKTKNVRSKDFTRDAYRKLALQTVQELKKEFIKDWINLGMSCDFSKSYSTIDPHCQKTAQKSFIELYRKNLIYRKETPISWCPLCQTAIAQAEFENVELQSHFNDIIFKSGTDDLIIATTRPELLPACVGLFAHPEDVRYKHLKGKMANVPLFNYEVPIMFDETVAIDKGTGLMMCCTFGDKEDIEKWNKYDLPLRVVFTRDGKMEASIKNYAGLSIKDARKQIIADLKTANLLLNQQNITHPVNVHERCGTEIEFMKTAQWFIKILDHKEELLLAANDINWYPQHMKIRYIHWVENLNWDWCISRQRFYGVPFPLWFTPNGEVILADESQLPIDPFLDKPASYKGDSSKLIPENDVMDTWNISSISPQIILNWAEKDSKMKNYPISLRPQAHDIIRTWAFYTIVKGLYHQGQVPWKNIVISGHVLDPKGNKMSKSKGNAIPPQDVLTNYGADALRYWAAGSKLGEDLPYQEKDVLTGKKTVTKLWNASKFTLMNLQDYKAIPLKDIDLKNIEVMDKWLVSKLMKIIKNVTDSFDKYEYSAAKRETDVFFWQNFCDNYLEFVKHRTYNATNEESKIAAQKTLYYALLTQIKLFAPIMPFITEEIYQMYFKDIECKESIHVSSWPEYNPELIDEHAEKAGELLVQVIAELRKHKSTRQLSLKAELSKVTITGNVEQLNALGPLIKDIKTIGLIQELNLEEGTEFNVVIE